MTKNELLAKWHEARRTADVCQYGSPAAAHWRRAADDAWCAYMAACGDQPTFDAAIALMRAAAPIAEERAAARAEVQAQVVAERAAVVAYLRKLSRVAPCRGHAYATSDALTDAASTIERGDHITEPQPSPGQSSAE